MQRGIPTMVRSRGNIEPQNFDITLAEFAYEPNDPSGYSEYFCFPQDGTPIHHRVTPAFNSIVPIGMHREAL